MDHYWELLIGGIIGALAARMVAMTAMPEMVALFNGFGGLASLLVGFAALFAIGLTNFSLITILLSIFIGGLTFTGSLIAYGKLSEKISGKPFLFTGQQILNFVLILAMHLFVFYLFFNPTI